MYTNISVKHNSTELPYLTQLCIIHAFWIKGYWNIFICNTQEDSQCNGYKYSGTGNKFVKAYRESQISMFHYVSSLSSSVFDYFYVKNYGVSHLTWNPPR
jgi:hypothetical protein